MPDADERELRVELAAAFRLAAQLDWHESVGNHFSVAVSADGRRFLMNPRWKHFALLRASDLQLLDSSDEGTMSRPDAPDPSAWCIHGRIHARLPSARCVLHLHPPYGTALSTLADPGLLPIDQNTARFYNRLAIDHDFGGIADESAEGERLAAALAGQRRMIMGNHGLIVTAATVAEAFEDLYFLERAARTLMLAYATGRPLKVMPPELAERTARGWDAYRDAAFAHFRDLRQLLDARDPSYRD
ncbi:MAG: class II aldolase/adducin family protein [Proteobacteria bacterium]|nr:class II aldolase/adducin family protein [Pseudomonadota bacterium]